MFKEVFAHDMKLFMNIQSSFDSVKLYADQIDWLV